MVKILWVEDQTHWISKFKSILEQVDLATGAINQGAIKEGANDAANTPILNDVQVFKFAEAARMHIAQSAHAPDIAILDANMNGNDQAGFSVSRALHKKWPELPVIYLSEHSGTGIEQQAFEETGAQDFIAKHQQNIEAVLCWRIKAALKKSQLSDTSSSQHRSEILQSGSLTIDTLSWNVYWHGERLMNPTNERRPLPPTPRKILRYLVEASPTPLNTSQIVEKLDADSERFSDANYRQHIRTLRQSIEQAAARKGEASFTDLCKSGKGITTFGDSGAYCWIKE
jgi:two-component system OmpR family response regulator